EGNGGSRPPFGVSPQVERTRELDPAYRPARPPHTLLTCNLTGVRAKSRITPACSHQRWMYAHFSWVRRTLGSAWHHRPSARRKPADEAGPGIAGAPEAACASGGAVPQEGASTPVSPV